MKKILLLLTFFTFFIFLASKQIYAADRIADCSITAENSCDILDLEFHTNNTGTNWEVRYWYLYTTPSGGDFHYPSRTHSVMVNNGTTRVPGATAPVSYDNYRVQWYTNCVDPTQRPYNTFDSALDGIGKIYYFSLNIDPRDAPASWKPKGNGQNLGTVEWTGGSTSFNPSSQSNCYNTYSIDGYVFNDKDGNGKKDNGELYYNTGDKAIEKWGDYYEDTGSNSKGYYRFYNLPPRDDYGVKLNVPSGFKCTTNNDCKVGCQSQDCGSGINLNEDKTYNFGIRCALPDLIVQSNFKFPGGYDDLKSTPTISIKNIGIGAVTDDFIVRVSNGSGDVREKIITQTVSPGEVIDLSNAPEFKDMGRPSAGDYTAVATVDAKNSNGNDKVSECDENNNTQKDNYTTTKPAPDLVCTSFNFPGGDQDATSDITLVIKNQGVKSFTKDFTVRVNNGNGGGKSVPVTEDFSPGESLDISSSFKDMQLPPAGKYTASVNVDLNDDIEEFTNESNNKDCTDTYRSTNFPMPDLIISALSFPAPNERPAGTSQNFTLTIKNKGNASANNFYVRLYPQKGESYFKPRQVTSALAAGETRDLSFAFTNIPLPVLTGEHTAYAIVDYGNKIDELNDENNTKEFDYITTDSALAKYTITGGIYIENIPVNNSKDDSEDYFNQDLQLQITGPSGYSALIDSPASEEFTSGPLNQGQYTLTLPFSQSALTGYTPSSPSFSGTSPSVTVLLGPGCNAETMRENSDCDLVGNISKLNFGVYIRPPQPWIQSVGGDIRVDNAFLNEMPTNTDYFSTNETTKLLAGVVFGNPGLLLGNGLPNQKNWYVDNFKFKSSQFKSYYENVKSKLQKNGTWNDTNKTQNLFDGSTAACNIVFKKCNFNSNFTPLSSKTIKIFKSDRDITLSSVSPYTFTGGGIYIFMVDGKIFFDQDVFVDPGTFVIFIAKNDIVVANNVTSLQGLFSAGNNFEVKSSDIENDEQLKIEGNVLVNAARKSSGGTFIKGRNMEYQGNSIPVVQLKIRPDFILNFPDILNDSEFKTQEVAPGE